MPTSLFLAGCVSNWVAGGGFVAFAIYAIKTRNKNASPVVAFDLGKMQKIYDDYTTNFHPGVVMVMGHPFKDRALSNLITSVQGAVAKVFSDHRLDDLLTLYDPEYQVHATIVELAGQHDKNDVVQRVLRDEELVVSHRNKQRLDIDFAIEWIKKTQPFRVEMGPNAFSEGKRNEALKITDTGQIVIKGRPENRTLLANSREKLKDGGNILHKYPGDEEVHAVLGYTKPSLRLHSLQFRQDLTNCLAELRSKIQFIWEANEVSIIAFDQYTLAREACFWEQRFLLGQAPNLNLLETMRTVMHESSERRLKQSA